MLNGRFQLTLMAWGAPQDRMRERSELGASSGHLDPETDGSMDLDSSELGDYCTMGGKSAVADHISVCSHVRLAACSGVTKHITQCGDYAGLPAQPAQAWRREIASLRAMAAGRARRLEPECDVGTPGDDIS